MALTERPDLRLTICQALRLLVSKMSDNGKSHQEIIFDDVLARYALQSQLLRWL